MVAVQIQRAAGLGDIIRAGAEHIVCSGFDNTAIDRGSAGIGAGGRKSQSVRAILCQAARAGEVEVQGVIVATLENHLALIVYNTIIRSHGSPVVDGGLARQSSPCIHIDTTIVIYCGVMGCTFVDLLVPIIINGGIVGNATLIDILRPKHINEGIVGYSPIMDILLPTTINGGIVGYPPIMDMLLPPAINGGIVSYPSCSYVLSIESLQSFPCHFFPNNLGGKGS
ncbi:Uncharacterised protein [Yersinia frederiksenii]|nr:Uncharacterised protein [Yersinia frederiksenii]